VNSANGVIGVNGARSRRGRDFQDYRKPLAEPRGEVASRGAREVDLGFTAPRFYDAGRITHKGDD
jgi:hypothetical protein